MTRDGSVAGGSAAVTLGPGGEFDLVRRMQRRWGDRSRGIGDDAAVLELAEGERIIASTDSSVELVHFRRDWLSPEEIGYRAVAAALSDLAAMAARPIGILVALVLPEGWRGELDALAEGIGGAALAADAPIVGGDISRGERLVLSITVIGGAERPARRDAIAPGDHVYVTGLLGGPAGALRAFQAGRAPDPTLRARFARPTPRIREARMLSRQGASAMIDISDGLASELRHLAAAGRVEIGIDLDRVPVLRGCALEDAVRGGEEYELIVTSPHELDVDAFAREFALPLSAIGRVHPAQDGGATGVIRATRGGTLVDLGAGHDHFST